MHVRHGAGIDDDDGGGMGVGLRIIRAGRVRIVTPLYDIHVFRRDTAGAVVAT